MEIAKARFRRLSPIPCLGQVLPCTRVDNDGGWTLPVETNQYDVVGESNDKKLVERKDEKVGERKLERESCTGFCHILLSPVLAHTLLLDYSCKYIARKASQTLKRKSFHGIHGQLCSLPMVHQDEFKKCPKTNRSMHLLSDSETVFCATEPKVQWLNFIAQKLNFLCLLQSLLIVVLLIYKGSPRNRPCGQMGRQSSI